MQDEPPTVGVHAVDRRAFTAGERRFALTVAGQAAQSFDRAMLSDRRWEATQVLQRALLPAALPALERVALAARYRPAAREIRAGGDWYTVLPLDGGRVALTVGDVVGHGAAAAAVMGQLRAVLSSALLAGAGPAGALRAADRFVALLPGARGSSALVLVLDPASRDVTWSAAGHLPPLQVSGRGAAYLDAAPQVLLGAIPDIRYADATARLDPGAAVVLYTDGLVERRGEILDVGLSRLRDAASRAYPSVDHLLDELAENLASDGPSDDIAILGIKWKR